MIDDRGLPPQPGVSARRGFSFVLFVPLCEIRRSAWAQAPPTPLDLRVMIYD
jgi:hypothetical protein